MVNHFIGKVCPYCQFPINQDSEVIVCLDCKTPHHKECWLENARCTTFGCQGISGGKYYSANFTDQARKAYMDQQVQKSNAMLPFFNKYTIVGLIIGFSVGLLSFGGFFYLTGYNLVLPGKLPEEWVIDDPYEEQEEEPEELEELPSSSEKEDSEDEREEETGSESVEQEDGGEAVPAEQHVTGDYKVIADGDYLLALVTKETTLKSSYSPADLKQIPSYMNPSYEMYLRSEVLALLEQLYQAAEEDGVALGIRSAYRSYSTQKRLFNDYASRHGEEVANRFSARPGQSEHQLGTTADFGGTAVDFTADFGQTVQGKWLAEKAYKYGFALSYPPYMEHITGYLYRSWHYRYIGVEAAREWEESGLTLREYLETKPQNFE